MEPNKTFFSISENWVWNLCFWFWKKKYFEYSPMMR